MDIGVIERNPAAKPAMAGSGQFGLADEQGPPECVPVLCKDVDKLRPVDLDVMGVQKLLLRVTDAGDGNNSDHADWANAVLHQVP
jgi:hypothetical protein